MRRAAEAIVAKCLQTRDPLVDRREVPRPRAAGTMIHGLERQHDAFDPGPNPTPTRAAELCTSVIAPTAADPALRTQPVAIGQPEDRMGVSSRARAPATGPRRRRSRSHRVPPTRT